MDLYPTFARVAGSKVPADRILDGMDQTDFFLGCRRSPSCGSLIIISATTRFRTSRFLTSTTC